jgi:hypothetical protein
MTATSQRVSINLKVVYTAKQRGSARWQLLSSVVAGPGDRHYIFPFEHAVFCKNCISLSA